MVVIRPRKIRKDDNTNRTLNLNFVVYYILYAAVK